MSFAQDPMDVLASLNPWLPPTLNTNDVGSATDPFDPPLSTNDVTDQLDLWTNVSFSFDAPPGQALPTDDPPKRQRNNSKAQQEVPSATSPSDRDLTGPALWRQAMAALEASEAQCDLESTNSLPVSSSVTTLDAPAPVPATSALSPFPNTSTVQEPSTKSSEMTHWLHQALASPAPPLPPPSSSFSCSTTPSQPAQASTSSHALDALEPPTKRARTSPVLDHPDPQDTTLSREADKRRRNTAASARTRNKKKVRAAAFEAEHKELQRKFTRLEEEQTQLRTENERLRSTLGVGSEVDLSAVVGLPLLRP